MPQPPAAPADNASLPPWCGTGADAAALADALVEAWRGIEGALAPIIGHRGVTALHLRCRQVAAREHPWLQVARDVTHDAIDLAALRDVVAQQEADAARAGGDALLLQLHRLLTGLVGASLTARLLHPVWHPTTDASHPKDQTP